MNRHSWAVLLVLCAIGTPVAIAEVIQVGESCSLADAIRAANADQPFGGCPAGAGADTILLDGDITFNAELEWAAALPAVESEITIEGGGATLARAQPPTPLFRFFAVLEGGMLRLRDVTLTNGATSVGGAIFVLRGGLDLDNVRLVDNYAHQGGAIWALGPLGLRDASTGLSITRSEITGNEARDYVGGALVQYFETVLISESLIEGNLGSGGRVVYSNLTVDGSTISGNEGGGLRLAAANVQITNTTISGNGAESGAGLALVRSPSPLNLEARHLTIVGNLSGGVVYHDFCQGGCSEGSWSMSGSIVAGNTGVATDCGTLGRFSDGGGNFDSDLSCGNGFSTIVPGTEISSVLEDNGGLTPTHALLEGSPAIDAAGACGLAVDQRGADRSDGSCDSGAFELQRLLVNGGFSSDSLWPWRLHSSDWGATAQVDHGALEIDVGPGGANVISQLFQKDIELEGETMYALRFDASSSMGSNLRVRLLEHTLPFENYGLAQNVNVRPLMRSFEIIFTTTPGDKHDARLSFLLQFKDRPGFARPDEVYVFDNISLVKLDGQHEARTAEGVDLVDMPRRGFEDSFPVEPRLNIWR